MPAHDLKLVRELAADESKCEFFDVVGEELRAWSMDSDDLRLLIAHELEEKHWYKSEVTRKYYPGTISDYYSIWVDECGFKMFLKIIVRKGVGQSRLVVTSFKKDNRYDA